MINVWRFSGFEVFCRFLEPLGWLCLGNIVVHLVENEFFMGS